mmetsp:Transcript_139/g.394  ORF Transcript_139/g.394 Transcript_139/m.394 type:complete len:287 (+) Transcript_139:921-1781(+)
MGLPPVQLRELRDPALPALQCEVLALRVPLRRLPLRWRVVDAVQVACHQRRRARLLRAGRGRSRPRLLDARERRHQDVPGECHHHRGGRERHADALSANRLGRLRLRRAPRHGHPRHVDQDSEGGARRRALEHEVDRRRAAEPQTVREEHHLRGEPRPGHRRGQDHRLLADGRRDVHRHEHPDPPVALHRARPGPPQDDPHGVPRAGRGLPQLPRQRVRASRVGRLPARGQWLELPPRQPPLRPAGPGPPALQVLQRVGHVHAAGGEPLHVPERLALPLHPGQRRG